MVKLVVTLGFLIAFAAGLVVGMETHTFAPAATVATTHPSGPHGLAAELSLTQQQQDQMKGIWSDMAKRGRGEQADKRQQLRHDRDDAIAALIPADAKPKYDEIQKNFKDSTDQLDREVHDAWQDAVKRAMAILTPEQQAKYQEMLAKHQSFEHPPFDRGFGGPHDRGMHEMNSGHEMNSAHEMNRRGDDRATTQPRSGETP